MAKIFGFYRINLSDSNKTKTRLDVVVMEVEYRSLRRKSNALTISSRRTSFTSVN